MSEPNDDDLDPFYVTPEEFFKILTADCNVTATIEPDNPPPDYEWKAIVLPVPNVEALLALPLILVASGPPVPMKITLECSCGCRPPLVVHL